MYSAVAPFCASREKFQADPKPVNDRPAKSRSKAGKLPAQNFCTRSAFYRPDNIKISLLQAYPKPVKDRPEGKYLPDFHPSGR